jgi:hypothetical protein
LLLGSTLSCCLLFLLPIMTKPLVVFSETCAFSFFFFYPHSPLTSSSQLLLAARNPLPHAFIATTRFIAATTSTKLSASALNCCSLVIHMFANDLNLSSWNKSRKFQSIFRFGRPSLLHFVFPHNNPCSTGPPFTSFCSFFGNLWWRECRDRMVLKSLLRVIGCLNCFCFLFHSFLFSPLFWG